MSGSDRICTIVARNYVAQARVLASSVAAHEPESPFITLVVDGIEEDRSLEGVGRVVLPGDLGVPRETVAQMQLIYDVMEYATALKPALLMSLLRDGVGTATYLDPDIRVYGGIGDIFAAAQTSGLALTPHTLEPLPRDGRMLDESVIMHAGIYNLGFVSTSPAAYRFLAWWHDRLRTDAVVDLGSALFTDQRWMDWAPSFLAPAILRDKGLNAAYWNLHERPIGRDADGAFTAGGVPLRFFHFSGYDPAVPHLLSKHQGTTPRHLLSEGSDLAALCASYGQELVDSGHVEMRRAPYRHATLPGGLRLTLPIRRLCRDALTGDRTVAPPPPDPWNDEPAFVEWLQRRSIGAEPRISRFELSIWQRRPDLRAAFPDPVMSTVTEFRRWLDEGAEMAAYLAEAGLPPSAPALRGDTPARRHRLGGWSVLGYANAELGVGEAGRRLGTAIGCSGLPWEMVALREGPLSRQEHTFRGELRTEPGYDNVVLAVNADQTPRVASSLGPRARLGHRIGYWFWELEQFPEHLHPAFDHVDEVWVASEFNRAAIQPHTDKPVSVIPVPALPMRTPPRFTRRQLGLPEDRVVFLVNFDYLSVLRRKNPLGAIEAYRRAFGPDDGAALLVKSINGHLRLDELELVRRAAADRPDIHVVDRYASAAQLRAMTALADVVVSLHRSEGYGLNLLDAMSAGTPVVATAYSGNMQFMDQDSALLVPWEETRVGDGAGPYPRSATWAEPDLDAAAALLRVPVDDPARTAQVVEAARRRADALSAEALGARARALLLDTLHPEGGRPPCEY